MIKEYIVTQQIIGTIRSHSSLFRTFQQVIAHTQSCYRINRIDHSVEQISENPISSITRKNFEITNSKVSLLTRIYSLIDFDYSYFFTVILTQVIAKGMIFTDGNNLSKVILSFFFCKNVRNDLNESSKIVYLSIKIFQCPTKGFGKIFLPIFLNFLADTIYLFIFFFVIHFVVWTTTNMSILFKN